MDSVMGSPREKPGAKIERAPACAKPQAARRLSSRPSTSPRRIQNERSSRSPARSHVLTCRAFGEELVPTSRAFAFTAALARVSAFFMFGLVVLGSVVRTTGSGLACPDWPLCEGRVIPRLEPHVLIEWSHRTLALLASLLVFGTALSVMTRAAVRARLGGLIGLAITLLLAQVLLGALTVWELLSPALGSSPLAAGLLLF